MATEIRWRRGTQAQNDAFTGALAEITVDTDNNELRVHDGVTAGGHTVQNATALAAHEADTANPHAVTKTQVGLGNVTNDAQLKAASNLADLGNKATALSNLGLTHKNLLINGGFDIWQRGTSFSVAGGAVLTADRWKANAVMDGGAGTLDVSQVAFAVGQTAVPGLPRYYLRMAYAAGFGTNGWSQIRQQVEFAKRFSGKTVTYSFFAKASVARDIPYNWEVSYGTGGTPSADEKWGQGSISLTTSWQRFTITTTVPDLSGKTWGSNGNDSLFLIFWPISLGTNTTANSLTINGADGTFTLDIANIQLEVGSFASDFEQRPVGYELALCQRYYEVGIGRVSTYVGSAAQGHDQFHGFRVTKRGVPALTVSNVVSLINATGISGGTDTSGITLVCTGVGAAGAVRGYCNWSADSEL